MSKLKTNTIRHVDGSNDNITLDSSQNVKVEGKLKVGTTTEGYSSADDLTIETAGHTGITIRSGTSSEGALMFSDGTSGADEYRGYIQYAHGTNDLRLATDGAERFRIDSSGRVLIGTTTADDTSQKLKLHQAGNDNCLLNLTVSNSTYSSLINFGDAASYGVGQISYAHSDDSLRFKANATERLKITSAGTTEATGAFRVKNSGNTSFNIRDTSANAVSAWIDVKTAGSVNYNVYKEGVGTKYPHVFEAYTTEYARIDDHGIKFNGDTASANGLDDYEEGTWTPTIANATIATQKCAYYTKIGNIVYIQGYFETASGSGGSVVSMGGLPYTVSSASHYNSYACGRIGSNSFTNSANDIVFQFNGSTTTFTPIVQDGNINEGMASATHMIFSGFYHV